MCVCVCVIYSRRNNLLKRFGRERRQVIPWVSNSRGISEKFDLYTTGAAGKIQSRAYLSIYSQQVPISIYLYLPKGKFYGRYKCLDHSTVSINVKVCEFVIYFIPPHQNYCTNFGEICNGNRSYYTYSEYVIILCQNKRRYS